MTSRAGLLLAFLAGILAIIVVMKVVGPTNYEDCVLKGLQGGSKSDLAIEAVAGACRRKFPTQSQRTDSSPPNFGLPVIYDLDPIDANNKLIGRAGLSFGNRYAGDLYNGFDSVTITAVRVGITTKVGRDSSDREYLVPVRIAPLTTEHFSFDIILGDPGAKYAWYVAGAQGFVKR